MARPTKKDLQAELKEVKAILKREELQWMYSHEVDSMLVIEQTKLLIQELENEILYNF